MGHNSGEEPLVEIPKPVEPPVETRMQTEHQAAGIGLVKMLPTEQQADHDGRQRARQRVGGQHREDDGRCERRE